MREADLFLLFIEPLNTSGLPYMVTGSVAGIIYGRPRLTHDIDLVLELGAEKVNDFISLFPPEQFYCPPEEVIKTEIGRETRGHFNIIHHETGFKADVYPIGKDELHEWAMARRTKVAFDNSQIYLAPPEYVIIRKLQFYKEGHSEKHLIDIKMMLEISGDLIDKSVLSQKIAEYDLSDQWESLQSIT